MGLSPPALLFRFSDRSVSYMLSLPPTMRVSPTFCPSQPQMCRLWLMGLLHTPCKNFSTCYAVGVSFSTWWTGRHIALRKGVEFQLWNSLIVEFHQSHSDRPTSDSHPAHPFCVAFLLCVCALWITSYHPLYFVCLEVQPVLLCLYVAFHSTLVMTTPKKIFIIIIIILWLLLLLLKY